MSLVMVNLALYFTMIYFFAAEYSLPCVIRIQMKADYLQIISVTIWLKTIVINGHIPKQIPNLDIKAN